MRTRVISTIGILSLAGLLMACGSNNSNCDETLTDCSGECVDLQTDPDNCGTCGTAVGAGQTCEGGMTVDLCTSPELFCGGGCVDPDADENYCGATDCLGGQEGVMCDPNEECNSGACECPQDYTACDMDTCVNLDNNIDHCGACYNQCETANGASCIEGVCRADVTYAGTLAPQTGRWDFNGNIGLPAGDAECEANWANSTVCTASELIWAGDEGQLIGAVDNNQNPVASWWNNDDAAGDIIQCVFTTMENVRWSYETAHDGNGGSFYPLNVDGSLGDLDTSAVCGDTHAVACCYRAVAIP